MSQVIFHYASSSVLSNTIISTHSENSKATNNDSSFTNRKGVRFETKPGLFLFFCFVFVIQFFLKTIDDSPSDRKGFGLTSLTKLLNFFCCMLQMNLSLEEEGGGIQTDQSCYLGLRVLSNIFETCDLALFQRSQLLEIIQFDLSSHYLLKVKKKN